MGSITDEWETRNLVAPKCFFYNSLYVHTKYEYVN